MATPILVSWSGGKDSAHMLYHLLQDSAWEIVGLLCTLDASSNRVPVHGVRRTLVERQVAQMPVGPLIPISIPPGASNEVYEQAWAQALAPFRAQGIRHVAFGDIFLEDIRAYRERQLAALGMEALFPIWTGTPAPEVSRALVERFLQAGFRTRMVGVDARYFEEAWAGRILTRQVLDRLPEEVDPCGERGEYHTFVFEGPLFHAPVAHRLGQVFSQGGFHYRDLLEA